MKNFTKLLFTILSLTLAAPNFAQDLVSSQLVDSQTEDQLISTFGVALTGFIKNGVNLYKITYTTPDIYGVQDTASGLLLVPDDLSREYPVLSYSHGTVGSKQDIPSNLQGGYQLALVIASVGYVTVAADFLGLGESRGFHPYVHADTEASASIDMLFATRQFAEQNDVFLNEQLFITGYSQGGHASLATHRSIQLDFPDEFTVTASAPMAGPYEIYGAQTDFTLGDTEFFYPAFLPYVALGYRDVYNIFSDLEHIFKPDFVPMIEDFENGIIDLGQLNDLMINKLNQDFGAVIPKNMMQDTIVDHIHNNPDHPVSMALADNNLLDWVPQAPTRLIYCGMDDQVSFMNSVVAEAAFVANGAPDLQEIDANPFLDHTQCVSPATILALSFFNEYQQITDILSTFNPDQLAIDMYPNPASNHLNFEGIAHEAELRILDLTGKVYQYVQLNIGNTAIDISNLKEGVFVAEIIENGKVWRQKLIKN